MISFRPATAADAGPVAALHADSWRRHYRGAYSDLFLDGNVGPNRLAFWSPRLAAPAGSATTLAEQDGDLIGFAHVIFDHDPRWGSLVDNLHVRHDQRRSGLGTRLMAHAATAAVEHATAGGLYLWVLEQNTAAQQFYERRGGVRVETALASAPEGNPANLNGTPRKHRMAWAEAESLTQ